MSGLISFPSESRVRFNTTTPSNSSSALEQKLASLAISVFELGPKGLMSVNPKNLLMAKEVYIIQESHSCEMPTPSSCSALKELEGLVPTIIIMKPRGFTFSSEQGLLLARKVYIVQNTTHPDRAKKDFLSGIIRGGHLKWFKELLQQRFFLEREIIDSLCDVCRNLNDRTNAEPFVEAVVEYGMSHWPWYASKEQLYRLIYDPDRTKPAFLSQMIEGGHLEWFKEFLDQSFFSESDIIHVLSTLSKSQGFASIKPFMDAFLEYDGPIIWGWDNPLQQACRLACLSCEQQDLELMSYLMPKLSRKGFRVYASYRQDLANSMMQNNYRAQVSELRRAEFFVVDDLVPILLRISKEKGFAYVKPFLDDFFEHKLSADPLYQFALLSCQQQDPDLMGYLMPYLSSEWTPHQHTQNNGLLCLMIHNNYREWTKTLAQRHYFPDVDIVLGLLLTSRELGFAYVQPFLDGFLEYKGISKKLLTRIVISLVNGSKDSDREFIRYLKSLGLVRDS